MKNLFLIIFVFGYLHLFSQQSENDSRKEDKLNYAVVFTSKKNESHIRSSMQVKRALIQLRIHPLLNLNSDQMNLYLKLVDTIKSLNNAIIIDSISITLNSGISWNLRKGPPQPPKNFYLKILTKKGKKDQAVIDRLKYLQYCHDLEKNNIKESNAIEKFNTYYAILIDNTKYLVMAYEIKLDEENHTRITKKRFETYEY